MTGHTTLSATTASRVAGSPSSGTSVAANPGNDNSSSGKKSSNTGAIAGGVAGGVVVLALIGGILLYFLRKRKPQQAPSSAYVVDPTPQPTPMGQVPQPQPSPLQPSDDGTSYVPGTPVASMKFYVRSLHPARLVSLCTHIFFAGPQRSYHLPWVPERTNHARRACPRRTVRWELEWEHTKREHIQCEPIRWEHNRQHADRAPCAGLPRLAYRLIVVYTLDSRWTVLSFTSSWHETMALFLFPIVISFFCLLFYFTPKYSAMEFVGGPVNGTDYNRSEESALFFLSGMSLIHTRRLPLLYIWYISYPLCGLQKPFTP